MYNQVQGTYPQLAGSFYNSAGMMPHDNGRTAPQVPTFFGGLQNMMSASAAMTNYQNIPLGQSILATQAGAGDIYSRSMGAVLGGVGTGISTGVGIASLGAMFSSNSLLGMAAGPLGLLAAGTGGLIVSGYKRRMQEIEDMRRAMSGSRFGFGMTNAYTGQLTNQAALDLSDRMRMSATGAGFQSSDFNKVMGSASNLGMLNGMSSISQVTKRVTDLAKASRDIVMLGEGISMQDAMHLQKLTQDMGISTSKFRGMNLGKNLVAAARAANMSMDQAAQLGGQGAMTFQQMGFGAAAGMNAAFYSNTAANALSMTGNISQRQLAAFGGVQGLGQSLLAGQAGTLGRFSDAMIMGAVKLDRDGGFRLDRELLDRYVRGDVDTKHLIERGKSIGEGLSKGQKNAVLEQLRFSMPKLKESLSDMLGTEEIMSVQGKEILNLRNKTGLSMRMAAHSYFQDANQAEAFLKYSQNYGAVRAENRRQRRIGNQEEMLRYAGMAKSSGGLARAGRAVGRAFSTVGEIVVDDGLGIGRMLADSMAEYADRVNRGASAMFAHDLDYSTDNLSADILRRGRTGLSANARVSFSELLKNNDIETFRRLTGAGEVMELGAGGVYSRFADMRYGDRSLKSVAELTGIDMLASRLDRGFMSERQVYEQQAKVSDQIALMSDIRGRNRTFNYRNRDQREAFGRIRDFLMQKSLEVYKGSSEAGGYQEILPEELLRRLRLTDNSDTRQALAEAYRYMESSSPANYRSGYSKMVEKVQAFGSLRASVSDSVVDELTLSGGAVLSSKGLSAALRKSGLSNVDLQKLVTTISERGHTYTQDGATPTSASFILNEAQISARNPGRAAELIRTLMQARVRSGVGKNREEVDLVGARGMGKRTISASALRGSTDAYVNDQLRKLDAGIAQALGHTAGSKFRADLVSLMGGEDAEEQMFRSSMPEGAEAQLEASIEAKMLEEENLIKGLKAEEERVSTVSFRLFNRKVSDRVLAKVREKRAQLKNLGYVNNRGEFDPTALANRRNLLRAKEEKTLKAKVKGDIQARTGGKVLFSQTQGFSSLSDVLNTMAGKDEDKKEAYGALRDSGQFRALETDFIGLQAKVAAGAMNQKTAQDILLKKLTDAIVSTGNQGKITGKESDTLPAILKQIATGLTSFNSILREVANQGSVTISKSQIKAATNESKDGAQK